MANPGPNIVTTAMNLGAVAAGVGKQDFTVWSGLLASLATGDLVTNYVFGFKGRVLAVKFIVNFAATTAAKLATLTARLVSGSTTTSITGGVLALTSATVTPSGIVVLGTAVTALNAFTATDGLTITTSGVTAFVEGSGTLVVTVVNDDTMNAIARSMSLFNP